MSFTTEVMTHQGQYPVIFVTPKDIKEKTFQETSFKLSEVLASLYDRHRNIGHSPRLSDKQKNDFELIRNRQAGMRRSCGSTA